MVETGCVSGAADLLARVRSAARGVAGRNTTRARVAEILVDVCKTLRRSETADGVLMSDVVRLLTDRAHG